LNATSYTIESTTKKKMAKNEEDNQKTSMYIHHPGIESSSTAVLFAPNH